MQGSARSINTRGACAPTISTLPPCDLVNTVALLSFCSPFTHTVTLSKRISAELAACSSRSCHVLLLSEAHHHGDFVKWLSWLIVTGLRTDFLSVVQSNVQSRQPIELCICRLRARMLYSV